MRWWYKESNISKWNIIERSEIDLQAKSQLTSDKTTMTMQWEKPSLSDTWCWNN
jgi:hypothetical protein